MTKNYTMFVKNDLQVAVDIMEEFARLVIFAHKLEAAMIVDVVGEAVALFAHLRKARVVRRAPCKFRARLVVNCLIVPIL